MVQCSRQAVALTKQGREEAAVGVSAYVRGNLQAVIRGGAVADDVTKSPALSTFPSMSQCSAAFHPHGAGGWHISRQCTIM